MNRTDDSRPTALVTGFSSGIGFAYSKYLSERNWNLELIARDENKAKKAYENLGYKHSRYLLADLSKPEGVKSVYEGIKSPDLIVANAGITKSGEVGSMNDHEKKDLFYLLCLGVIELLEKYIPTMKIEKKGRIVIISSIGAITPMPKSSIYAAAKSGIFSYGQSLSRELKRDNVNITVSLPGYVKTEAHKRAGLDHLNEKIPSWMWVDANQVVKETEMASIKGKSTVIPGLVYKMVRPFLQMSLANSLWNRLTKRRGD